MPFGAGEVVKGANQCAPGDGAFQQGFASAAVENLDLCGHSEFKVSRSDNVAGLEGYAGAKVLDDVAGDLKVALFAGFEFKGSVVLDLAAQGGSNRRRESWFFGLVGKRDDFDGLSIGRQTRHGTEPIAGATRGGEQQGGEEKEVAG